MAERAHAARVVRDGLVPEGSGQRTNRGGAVELLAVRRRAARAWLGEPADACRIKLCGMYRDEDVAAANDAAPDLVGFVSAFPRSHRNVEGATLARLSALVDDSLRRVVVLVDQGLRQAVAAADTAGADVIQLHGHEDDAYVRELRRAFCGGIIQAFRIREAADVERALASAADLVLLDAGQGSGATFDWSLVEGFGARRPYLLAGGLGPDNVGTAIEALRPWGVDMSSGIETDRLKDPSKMKAAVAAVRGAAAGA